jgi:hypothetical protein
MTINEFGHSGENALSAFEDMATGKLPLVDEMSLRALLYMLTEEIKAGL